MAFSTIQGSGGAPDSFVGTSGVDSIVFEGNTNNFFLGAQQANDFIGFDNVAALQTGTYTNGTLRGGAGIDNFQNLAGVNLVSTWLNGNSADDIFGANGAGLRLISSTLQGGQGDDTMFVLGASNSLFNGNRDDDTLSYTGTVTSSTIGGGQGDDALTQTGGNMTGSLILLGDGDDAFTVNNVGFDNLGDGNTITGGDGDDTIFVLNSNDGDLDVDGGAGVDVIITGSGVDTLIGGAGSDLLNGQADNDVLTGGTGVDTFDYANTDGAAIVQAAGAALTFGGADDLIAGTVDLITDFTTGTDFLNFATAGLAANFTNVATNVATTYTAALAANNADAATTVYEVYAVGNNNSFTSYLFINGPAAGADAIGAIQLGATGSFATTAGALSAIAAADII